MHHSGNVLVLVVVSDATVSLTLLQGLQIYCCSANCWEVTW